MNQAYRVHTPFFHFVSASASGMIVNFYVTVVDAETRKSWSAQVLVERTQHSTTQICSIPDDVPAEIKEAIYLDFFDHHWAWMEQLVVRLRDVPAARTLNACMYTRA